jgi:hypothetical protein
MVKLRDFFRLKSRKQEPVSFPSFANELQNLSIIPNVTSSQMGNTVPQIRLKQITYRDEDKRERIGLVPIHVTILEAETLPSESQTSDDSTNRSVYSSTNDSSIASTFMNVSPTSNASIYSFEGDSETDISDIVAEYFAMVGKTKQNVI